MKPALCLTLLVSLLAATGPGTQQAPQVVIDAWEQPRVQLLDADHLPPSLTDFVADATPNITWNGVDFTGDWDAAAATLTITGITPLHLSGRTHIRLPKDVEANVRHHEEGHDQLNGNEYARSARAILEEALGGFVGSRFKGVGADDATRQKDAWAAARAQRTRRVNNACLRLLAQMDALSAFYDEVTVHGTSRRVDTDKGIAAALRHRDLMAATGAALPAAPDTRPSAGTTGSAGPPTGR